MIVLPNVPGGFCVFCDDIREEVTGKLTLVGTYGGEISINSPAPVMLPQMAGLIVYRDDPHSFPKQINLKVLQTGSDEHILFEFGAELPAAPEEALEQIAAMPSDSQSFFEMRVPWTTGPTLISENCVLKVRLYTGGDEVRLGAISIKFRSSTAEPTDGERVS